MSTKFDDAVEAVTETITGETGQFSPKLARLTKELKEPLSKLQVSPTHGDLVVEVIASAVAKAAPFNHEAQDAIATPRKARDLLVDALVKEGANARTARMYADQLSTDAVQNLYKMEEFSTFAGQAR